MSTPRKYRDRALRQRAYRERQKAARLAEMRQKNMPATAPISTMPSNARWKALIEHAQETLRTALQEMETYRDERSEAWQAGDKAEALQERIDRIQEALNQIEAID